MLIRARYAAFIVGISFCCVVSVSLLQHKQWVNDHARITHSRKMRDQRSWRVPWGDEERRNGIDVTELCTGSVESPVETPSCPALLKWIPTYEIGYGFRWGTPCGDLEFFNAAGQGREALSEFYRAGGNQVRVAYQTDSDGIKPLPDDGTFVDVGSFTGEDLKVLAKARPGVQIYTFEPAPSFYSMLVKNLANYTNVRAKNVGLGPEKSWLCFFLRGSATWMEPMEQGKQDCRAGADKGSVVTVDEAFADIDSIDVLQINCEGCEYIVLQALVDSPEVMAKVKFVEVQFHHGSRRRSDYCKLLRAMGEHYVSH
eukprot:SAG31_NODE_1171_length_9560_cov_11.668745_2_plen_313_part_00